MAEFGGGIGLTRDLDIDLNNVGDINTINGQDELEKDLALQSIIALDGQLGQRMRTPSTEANIKATVRGVLAADPRIQTITRLTLSFEGRETVEVVAQVTTDDGEQELVLLLDE